MPDMNWEEMYAALFRKLNPRTFPYSPYGKQRELRDLWPVEQQRFKRSVDVVLKEAFDAD